MTLVSTEPNELMEQQLMHIDVVLADLHVPYVIAADGNQPLAFSVHCKGPPKACSQRTLHDS